MELEGLHVLATIRPLLPHLQEYPHFRLLKVRVIWQTEEDAAHNGSILWSFTWIYICPFPTGSWTAVPAHRLFWQKEIHNTQEGYFCCHHPVHRLIQIVNIGENEVGMEWKRKSRGSSCLSGKPRESMLFEQKKSHLITGGILSVSANTFLTMCRVRICVLWWTWNQANSGSEA